MIDPAVLLSLKTKYEIRIAILLSSSEDPMRQTDILKTLKIDKSRCRTALKNLVNANIVIAFFGSKAKIPQF